MPKFILSRYSKIAYMSSLEHNNGKLIVHAMSFIIPLFKMEGTREKENLLALKGKPIVAFVLSRACNSTIYASLS